MHVSDPSVMPSNLQYHRYTLLLPPAAGGPTVGGSGRVVEAREGRSSRSDREELKTVVLYHVLPGPVRDHCSQFTRDFSLLLLVGIA